MGTRTRTSCAGVLGVPILSALVLVSAPLSGCRLAEGLTGGPIPSEPDGAALDAGVDAHDAALDAFTPCDGQAGCGGSVRSFCATEPSHSFCSDFDDTMGFVPWEAFRVSSNSGSGSRDTANGFASPASYLFETTPIDAGSAAAYLSQSLPDGNNELVVGFTARIDKSSANGAKVTLAQIQIQDGTKSFWIGYAAGTMAAEVRANSANLAPPADAVYGVPVPPMGAWFKVRIDLVLAPPSISYSVDDVVVLDHRPILVPFSTGTRKVAVGIQYVAGPADVSRVHVDNVTIDVR